MRLVHTLISKGGALKHVICVNYHHHHHPNLVRRNVRLQYVRDAQQLHVSLFCCKFSLYFNFLKKYLLSYVGTCQTTMTNIDDWRQKSSIIDRAQNKCRITCSAWLSLDIARLENQAAAEIARLSFSKKTYPQFQLT